MVEVQQSCEVYPEEKSTIAADDATSYARKSETIECQQSCDSYFEGGNKQTANDSCGLCHILCARAVATKKPETLRYVRFFA